MIFRLIISIIFLTLIVWGIFEGAKKIDKQVFKYLFMGTSFVTIACAILFVIVQLF